MNIVIFAGNPLFPDIVVGTVLRYRIDLVLRMGQPDGVNPLAKLAVQQTAVVADRQYIFKSFLFNQQLYTAFLFFIVDMFSNYAQQ